MSNLSVYTRCGFGGLVGAVSAWIFLKSVYNIIFLQSLIILEGVPTRDKLIIFLKIFDPVFYTAQDYVQVSFVLIFGLQIALFMYTVNLYKAQFVSIATALSSGSFILAFLGIGCLSCGPIMITILATMLGASSSLISSWLNSLYLGILSLVLALFSCTFLIFKIQMVKKTLKKNQDLHESVS